MEKRPTLSTFKQQQEESLTDVERNLKCDYEKIKLVHGVHREVSGGLMKARLMPIVEEWANEAVTYYNKQVKYEKMRLKRIKEALYLSLPVLAYHINLDVILIEEDEKEAPRVCQAVVYKERKNGPVEVFSLKLGSPEGEGTEGWCRENHDCVCGVYLSLMGKESLSEEEWLKSECPGWDLSSDNELEAKKMKHNESPESGGGTQK